MCIDILITNYKFNGHERKTLQTNIKTKTEVQSVLARLVKQNNSKMASMLAFQQSRCVSTCCTLEYCIKSVY